MDKTRIDDVFRDIEALSFRAESLTEQAKQIKKELRNVELTLADALRAEIDKAAKSTPGDPQLARRWLKSAEDRYSDLEAGARRE